MLSQNERTYKLSLKRIEICDLMLACTQIVEIANAEMRDPECGEYRRTVVLPERIQKWQALHDELKTQLDEQDKKHEGKEGA